MYRILSFDGGGIRGLFTLLVLKRLEALRPKLISSADLIAGTSVGGIIALGLAAGFNPDKLASLFLHHPAEIFPRQNFTGKLRSSALTGPRYPNEGLTRLLMREFGALKLGGLKTKVMVASFSLDNEGERGRLRSWGPKFFHNFDEATGDMDVYCWKAALYTSAAPTYFPSVDGHIDGGVAVNDPSMCAVSLAKTHLRQSARKAEEISLLSVGTGRGQRFIDKDSSGWGILEWSPFILPLLMDAQSGIAEYQCRSILAERYLRLDSCFGNGKHVGLDELDALPLMQQAAESLELGTAIDWIDSFWYGI